jgi:murein DD-endopeptidase MepM/ murein hydrolase activator NlpD
LDDSFTVLYERDLSKNQEGTILAAEFFTQGNVYRAVRYKDEQGNIRYYTPSGDNLHPLETHEKMAGFQVPVDYTKITSTFGVRKHPILRRWLFHNGVDYAAPSGTPIVAAAPATVSFVGRKRGYGKMVMLKHDERYETLYAHLSGFPQGLREGDRVNQGAIIGYVGQTGFATGPPLHFEIRIDGIHQDPLLAQTLSSERITEVAKLDKASFFKQTKDILAQLDTVRQSLPIAETLPVLSKSAQTEYISTTDDVLVKTTQNAPTSEGDSWLFWPGYASSAHILTDSVER